MIPKVSIIIPVYNVEKYLPVCLDSAINQTLENIEIIIVNDCSPDNSENIILDYAQKDPRIIYIKHSSNTRQGGARNTGIRAASGEWIYFLDSDDYISLDILEKITRKCELLGANFGAFGRRDFGTFLGEKVSSIYIPSSKMDGQILNQHTISNLNPGPVHKIYKREDLLQHNVFFPENMFIEDWVFHYIYAASVEPTIAVIEDAAYHYRRNSESTMGQIHKNAVNQPLAACKIVEFLKQNNKWHDYKIPFLEDQKATAFHWFEILEPQYYSDFIKHFSLFCKIAEPSSDDIELFPAFCFSYLDDMPMNSKIALFKQFTENYLLLHNKWYMFGQLNHKQKIKKLLSYIFRKITKIFRLP
ncbi:MAG: glycosyltransferase family 2 protein [Brevinema sp.]